MDTVFVNGSFVSRADATLSAFDAGVTHALGLFETMTSVRTPEGPAVVRVGDHLDRLVTSARELGLSNDLNANALRDTTQRAVEKAFEESPDQQRARVRLSVTGGDLNLLAAARGTDTGREHRPTVLIDVQPATPYPDEMFDRGVRVAAADTRANPFNPFEGHKTLNYWWRLRELQIAASRGAAEAIVFSVTNHAVGGCVSNVFMVKDGKLLTPIARGEEPEGGIPSPVLPGVTRKAVFDLADEKGLTADMRMISFEELATADEVFLTNSSWGVLPVVGIEDRTIADGQPGEVTRLLLNALR